MKKYIALVLSITGLAVAQQFAGRAPITLIDNTDGTVTYIGTAYADADKLTTVSTNSAKWEIVKITNSGGVTTGIYIACSTNRGDQAMRTTAWALRASTNTVYKTAE